MIYEPNIPLILFAVTIIIWPVVFVALLIRDAIKHKPFRPFYRAVWPFIVVFELLSMAV